MTKKQLKKELEAVKAELALTERKVQNTTNRAEYANAYYRRIIENLTGVKFVFGYDPNDRSMVEGNENTYGWYQPLSKLYAKKAQ
jgi:hypothetical protein